MSRDKAALCGAVVSGVTTLVFELDDGYKDKSMIFNGFSAFDQLAAFAGGFLGYLDVKYPALSDYFYLKFSFNFSDSENLIRDVKYLKESYGQNYWIALGPKISQKILPFGIGKYIQPAFGISAKKGSNYKVKQFKFTYSPNLAKIPVIGRYIKIIHPPFLPEYKMN